MARALLLFLLACVALAPAAPTVRAAVSPRPTLANDATGRVRPPASVTDTHALGPGSRIPWQGQDWYFHGANVPWLNWARDFGGGAVDGVSNAENRARLSAAFAGAKANGVNIIRWWVFEGDAWQIKRDGSGAPVEVDDAVYADFDAAVELAEEHDLYLVFVLFSAPHHIPASWMEDPGQRSLLASALGVLFANYRDHPRVMTWEVFNEPEFDVWDDRAQEEPLRETIREIASSVHANSHAYVTVGGAMLDGLPMLKGLGLDYYQAHWYDYMDSGDWCALCTTYEEVQQRYDLDAPLVIGELYLSPELEDPLLRLEDFYSKGFAGAWPWSIFPDSTEDKFAIDWNSMRIFAGRHQDFGPRLTEALPPSDASPTMRLAFTSDAEVGASHVAPGETVPVDARVTGTAAVQALVDIEIYGPSGEQVHQLVVDDQWFGPGETKTISTLWTVPPGAAPGEYVVKVGVFTPGWGKVYNWNDAAATFTVGP